MQSPHRKRPSFRSLTGLALALLASATLGTHAEAHEDEHEMVLITGGTYEPFYPTTDDEQVQVEPFLLDVHPVTNAGFEAFVADNPNWARGQVPPLFADSDYLGAWASPDEPQLNPDAPVSLVSWFAARAYCEARGARLPTEAEWEFVGRADTEQVDATDDPAFLQEILNFYAQPRQDPPPVARGEPNYWGVYDMHGLIWEWVEDFNSSLVSADNRQQNDPQNSRFCGGAALGAEDNREYATFMRFAFRSSLEPSYTVRNLGFRCAADPEESP